MVVLSATTIAPALWLASATAAMSQISRPGLDGLSTKTMRKEARRGAGVDEDAHRLQEAIRENARGVIPVGRQQNAVARLELAKQDR